MTIQSLLIDRHQPAILHSLAVDGAPSIVTELAAGSLLITCADGTLIGVERLLAESLPHAIRREVLLPRVAALRQLTPWTYLVIVGTMLPLSNGNTALGGNPTAWTWMSIQGVLASVQEIGGTVLNIKSDTELPALLRTLSNRERTVVKLTPAREAIFTSPAEQILCALPGIGEEKAEAVLRDCDERAALALVALTDPRHNVTRGIGEKTVAGVREALGLLPGETLSIDIHQ